ncbi:hypothetical protein HYDPIDRAFT_32101 [Hydnomerulius pinastri MD-312]|uniref:Uncharacterized protein n=1 Tax=Hydnomerulius pinastri MD-312 TaxID=994086 RepID=A0A0C9VS74_9AGAM|nr:hypothetical protein HYDPIDRAFT_32101 [Hydnomerulius pinastri MD-312]
MTWPSSPSLAPGIAPSGRNAPSKSRAPSSPDVSHSLFQNTQAVRSELCCALDYLDSVQVLSSPSASMSMGRPGDTIATRAGPSSSKGDSPSMLPGEGFLLRSNLQHLDKALELMSHKAPTKQSRGIPDVSPPSNLQPLCLPLPSRTTGVPPSTPARNASPPTPVHTGPNSMQCSGTNKSRCGARCGRKVAIPQAHSPKDRIPALYCCNHTAQAAAYSSPPPSTCKAPVSCNDRKTPESGGQPEDEDEVAILSTLASKEVLELISHETPMKHSRGTSDLSPPSNPHPRRLPLPSHTTSVPPSTPTPPAPVCTGPNSVQCSGTNKSRGGARCVRKIRISLAHSPKDCIPALYCYNHTAQAAAYPSPLPSTRKVPVPCNDRKTPRSGGRPKYKDEVTISSTLTSKNPLPTQDPYSHGDQGKASPILTILGADR